MRLESQRFRYTHRLNNTQDFDLAFQRGRRQSNALFQTLSRPNALLHPRLGMAVSRRVARKAHQRNRIKRIVRESFRRHAMCLKGLDVVVLVKSSAVASSNDALFKAIDSCWRMVKQYHGLQEAVSEIKTRNPRSI